MTIGRFDLYAHPFNNSAGDHMSPSTGVLLQISKAFQEPSFFSCQSLNSPYASFYHSIGLMVMQTYYSVYNKITLHKFVKFMTFKAWTKSDASFVIFLCSDNTDLIDLITVILVSSSICLTMGNFIL